MIRRSRQPRPPGLSVAPMMERTDRPFRTLVRQISRRTLLYTEMIHAAAIVRGPARCLLAHGDVEHPIAVQLGGDDPAMLQEAARIAVDAGFDEVNLNVGCPSPRVQDGCFGAVLMRRPDRVAEAVAAMRAAVAVPVTVKHRLGVDDTVGGAFLARFVETVASAGCDRFTMHARSAMLAGLSPAENRTVPPLSHATVVEWAERRPDLVFELNGGVAYTDDVCAHLRSVDAVMIGRAWWDDPWRFHDVDRRVFDAEPPGSSRIEAARAMVAFACATGTPGHRVARVMLHLFAGTPGARRWRRRLSETALRATATWRDLGDAVEAAWLQMACRAPMDAHADADGAG